jgi:hypothetical protein
MKNYTGLLLDPTERIESCDRGHACDARLAASGVGWEGSRRCLSCGIREGGACCPPDNRYALGRCSLDVFTGTRLVCNDPWAGDRGVCVRCGFHVGDPACHDGLPCDTGMTPDDNGRCVLCGLPGYVACDWTGCDKALAVYDHGLCVAAGQPGQPCLQGPLPCRNAGVFCNQEKICESCGEPGQRCCPGGGPPCTFGDCRWAAWEPSEAGRCDGCGRTDGPVCQSGEPCREGGEPVGGWCRHCGRAGEPCCRSLSIVCDDGMRCRNRVCAGSPPSGGGGTGPKTCGGQAYTSSTKAFLVWVEGADGCLAARSVIANSPAEAAGCAQATYGSAALDAEPEEFEWAVHCPATGCTMTTFTGRDEASAARCAHNTVLGCTILDAPCP